MNQSKCRALFLIDDTRDYTNKYYIFEVVKIVLFQVNVFLPLSDICQRVEAITDMNYTEKEILNSIAEMNTDEIEFKDNEYALTSNGMRQLQQREKNISIKPFIRQFLKENFNDEDRPEVEKSTQLIYRFIYEKFNENIAQISYILEEEPSKYNFSQENYTAIENEFINGFLGWDNPEKNKLVYRLISKSFDYCMINTRCEKSSLDFGKFIFYLDTNIIFRLMGLNNEKRKINISTFVKKCLYENITIKISSFVYDECISTIENNIALLIESTQYMTTLMSPSSMSFAEEKSLRAGFYKLYYDWCRSGRKHRNYDGFRKYILNLLAGILSDFEVENNQISFNVTNKFLFNQLYDSLYEIKEDKHTTITDVNSILLVKSLRENVTDSETYLISSDKALIGWTQSTFKTLKTIVDYPSVWLSVLLKFTGREKDDDYKSFCQFINLPVLSESESDIKKKIDIKAAIMSSDFSDAIKDEMIQEIKKNYQTYRQSDTREIVHRAYVKTEDQIREEASLQEAKRLEKDYDKKNQKMQEKHQEELKELTKKHEEENNVAKKVSFKEGSIFGAEEMLNKMVQSKIKTNKRWRTFLSVISFLALGFILLAVVLFFVKKKFDFDDTISRIANVTGVVSFVYDLIFNLIKFRFPNIKILSIDEEQVYENLQKKIGK